MGEGRTNGGGGYDVSGVTATAADVSKAKYFVDSSGALTQGQIDLAGATASAADVSSSKKFINSSGALVQGTMQLSSADATVGNVRAGKKFIDKDGVLKTGTLADYTGSYSVTPSASAQTLQTQGKYMTANIVVAGTSGGVSSGTGSKTGDNTSTIQIPVSGISTSSSIIAWGITASSNSSHGVVMAAGNGTGNGSAVFAGEGASMLYIETGTVACNGIFTGFGSPYISFTANGSGHVFASGVTYSLWVKYM